MKFASIPLFVLSLSLVALWGQATTLSAGEIRVWTNQEGREVRAEFLGLENGIVQMKLPNGRPAATPLENLSEVDQQWVRDQTEKPTEPPPPTPQPAAPAPVPDHPRVNWAPLTDLGDRIPELPPIPDPPADALIAVDDWIGKRFFYMRPDGSDAFPHHVITSRISPFSDGLAWIKTGEYQGYIDREGEWVIGGDSGIALPEGGHHFEPFSDGMALFRVNNNIGFMDTSGKVIVPATVAFEESDDYYLTDFSADGTFASAVIRGKILSRIVHIPSKSVYGPVLRGYFSTSFREGLAAVSIGGDTKNRHACIDRSGELAFNQNFFDAPVFDDGFAVVRRAFGEDESDVRVVVINRKGEIVWQGEGKP